jgi:hypothetical protein
MICRWYFFQVSGLGRQVSGSGVQVQEICPLSSAIDAAL